MIFERYFEQEPVESGQSHENIPSGSAVKRLYIDISVTNKLHQLKKKNQQLTDDLIETKGQ